MDYPSRADAEWHRRRLLGIVLHIIMAVCVLALGAWVELGMVSLAGALYLVVGLFRLSWYMMRDFELRGGDGYWAWPLGFSAVGVIVWLIWRKFHPIRVTRLGARRRSLAGKSTI